MPVWLLTVLVSLLVLPVWAAGGGGGHGSGEGGGETEVSSTLPVEDPQLRRGRVYGETEVSVLLDLDKQRIEMNRREQALELREKLVDLMEQRLNSRVAELKNLQADLERLMGNVSGKDDKELDQLATIYGNMKPAVAAGVLNRLDNLIVLDVITRMPPKKSGKLMEAIDPAKARVISEMMAARTPPPSVSATAP